MKYTGKSLLLLTVVFFSLSTVAYRVSPAFVGAPVFSIDAWPLLADVKYLIHNGSAQYFPCASQVSCYYAGWPGLVLLTALVSTVTSAGIIWTPPIVTTAASLVYVLAVLLFVRFFRKEAVWLAALYLFAAAPANLFYSGYKQEMLAMPMLSVLLYLLAKRLVRANGIFRKSDILLLSILGFGIVDSHHFTTYVMLSTLTTLGLFTFTSNSDQRKRGLAIISSVMAALTFLFYALSNFTLLNLASYNATFLLTLASYNTVLSLVSWRSQKRIPAKPAVPWQAFAVAGIGVIVVPVMGRFLSVNSSLTFLGPELVFFLASLPIVATGMVISKMLDSGVSSVLLAWIVAPLSLLLFALFDGDSLLAYRGYTAAILPGIVFASLALTSLRNSTSKIFPDSRRRSYGFVLAFFLVISLGAGVYSDISPYLNGRDVLSGSTWFYPGSQVRTASEIFGLTPADTQILTDLPTLSLATFLSGNLSIKAAEPGSFKQSLQGSLLILKTDDTSAFYFYGALEGVSVNPILPGKDVVFRGWNYYIYS
jgi:hypothetical protein